MTRALFGADAHLTPRGEFVVELLNALLYLVVALVAIGLLLWAFKHGEAVRCDRLLNEGDLAAFQEHGCPTRDMT